MFAAEFFCPQHDAIEVERSYDMPNATVFERRKDIRIPNAIPIRFSFRGESRVECLRNEPAPHDANGRRQKSVEGGYPPIRFIAAIRQIHMRALRERMNARVGPPGPMNPDRFGTDTLKSGFDVILNPIPVRLALPAGKRRTVVRDDKLEPHRHLIARKSFWLRTAIVCALQSVEITLEDHLRRDLVDDVPRISRLAAAVT